MNPILRPLAAGFRLGVALRHAAYQRGWFKTRHLHRPVVSVGNLTVGGTGKTPLVAAIARILRKRGLAPSILTRGYGRRSRKPLVVLEPAATRSPEPCECGDEPALLARALPEVPMVICADRYRAGCVAEERFGVDVHLLDDGFQHLALARDIDIVVLDTTQEISDRALLPVGRLREPSSALKRADCVILTRLELGDPGPLEKQVRQINPLAAIFHTMTQFVQLVDIESGRIYPPHALEGEPVLAFCGIGNPKAFFADLRKWGFSVVAEQTFPDHYRYGDADMEVIGMGFKKSGATALVTTEKDARNLFASIPEEIPVVACVIESSICEEQAFEEWLLARLPAGGRAV
ncbi:MAG: tetraacyldisaccharide 4'-kinase [Acidobacteriia bacterium]|nr:tetraacyldisaccharide 4'-kinase [Terriglobia bacterium]